MSVAKCFSLVVGPVLFFCSPAVFPKEPLELETVRQKIDSLESQMEYLKDVLGKFTEAIDKINARMVSVETLHKSFINTQEPEIRKVEGLERSAIKDAVEDAPTLRGELNELSREFDEFKGDVEGSFAFKSEAEILNRIGDLKEDIAEADGTLNELWTELKSTGLSFSAGSVSLKNDAKKETAFLGASSQSGELRIHNQDGDHAGQLSWNGHGGVLRLFGDGAANIVWIGERTNGGVGEFRRINGRLLATIGAIGDGSEGGLALYNSRAMPVVKLSVDSDVAGGVASFLSNQGASLAEIGVNKNGQGMIRVNGRNIKDFAEVFEFANREGVIPGTVMSVSGDGGALERSQGAYDGTVVGVISGAGNLSSALIIGGNREDGSKDLPVAIAGQVYVRVNREGGNIERGDLLVSSSTPGVAMKANDKMKAFGAVIGKALEASHSGEPECLVRMLVMMN